MTDADPSLTLNVHQLSQAKLNQKLFEEIEAGNLAEVQNCIFWGADLRSRDGRFRTPLLLATCLNKTDIAEYFLTQKDVDVNVQDDLGYTPMHFAVDYLNIALVQKLLPLIGLGINLVENTLGFTALARTMCAPAYANKPKVYKLIQILLTSKDINIFATDCLSFVASLDDLRFLNMLISADPFPNFTCAHYQNALVAACKSLNKSSQNHSLCALRLLSAMPFQTVLNYYNGEESSIFVQSYICLTSVIEMQDNIIKTLLLGRRYKALQDVHGVIKNILYMMAPEWYVHRLEKDFRVLSTRFNKSLQAVEQRVTTAKIKRFNELVSKIKVPSPTLGFSPNAKQCMKNIPKQPLLIEYPKKTTDITEITRNIATLRLH